MDHINFFKFHDKYYMSIHYSNGETETQIIQIVENLDFTPGLTQTEHFTGAGPSCPAQARGNFLPWELGTVWARHDFRPRHHNTPATLDIEGSGFRR